jgi:O-methyltransferase
MTSKQVRRARLPDPELYSPLFEPWRSGPWREKLRADDPRSVVSLDRKYILYQLLSQSVARCPGAVAECGVYLGGTAYIFGAILQGKNRPLHLFDTFAGMPETNPEKDLHKKGDFGDTTLDGVRTYLRPFAFARFHPGFIPASLDAVADETFCFVHVDLDIYDSILSATNFFYRRTSAGGVIVYDDYGFPSCPGARQAVDAFYADKPEVPLALPTGQCVVWKL